MITEDVYHQREERPPNHRPDDDTEQQERRLERRSLGAYRTRRSKQYAEGEYGKRIGNCKSETCCKIAQNLELGVRIVHPLVLLPLFHGVFAEYVVPQPQHQYAANDADDHPVVHKKIGNERKAEARDQGIEEVAEGGADTHQEALPKAFLNGFLHTQYRNRAYGARRQEAYNGSSI